MCHPPPSALARCRGPLRAAVVAAVVIMQVMACSRSDRPPLGLVAGRVTRAGRPVAGALVLFTPEGPGRTSYGVTDTDGRYALTFLRDIRGATLGRHTVRITPDPDAIPDDRAPAWKPATDSVRTAEVQPGRNEIDLAIEPQ